MTKYVVFFLAFLIAIDLVALVLKLTHLFSTGGAYERSAAALRAIDVVERTACRSARLSSPAASRSRRGPRRMQTSSESGGDKPANPGGRPDRSSIRAVAPPRSARRPQPPHASTDKPAAMTAPTGCCGDQSSPPKPDGAETRPAWERVQWGAAARLRWWLRREYRVDRGCRSRTRR